MPSRAIASLIIVLVFFGCSKQQPIPDAEIDGYLAQYSPYEMSFDASTYPEKERLLLKKLVQAAEHLDTIFWLQTSKYGMRLRDSLKQVGNDEHAAKLLTLIERNAGPYELLNDNAVFAGNKAYYGGGEVYPEGLTSEEFDSYYSLLTESEKEEFMSPYTVIREDGKGGYKAIPYNVEYRAHLEPIVKLLEECADLSENASFASFLRMKAQALLTDAYFDSDVAWIDMEGNKFDIVFGPYETYSDEIKGVKAKYEASIEIVDQEESAKLDIYTKHLKEMEENLPIPDEYKSVVKGLTAKFVIVRDIVRKGEAKYGYQAVATNLPNDPEVHEKKGTKKTFWKNMFEARFNTIIKPVSAVLIDQSQQEYLSDQGFFQFVLMHEICHAVGPRTVKVGPKKGIATNAAIGPDYNALEEAKADIAGLHSLVYLMDKGIVDENREREFFVSFLGSLFRSIRFGLNQAHGKAAAISLNYLVTNGGVLYDESTGRWAVDFGRIREGVKRLSRELLILEGDGDTEKVKEFFSKWTTMTPQLSTSLEKVKGIAIDVMPNYSIKWE